MSLNVPGGVVPINETAINPAPVTNDGTSVISGAMIVAIVACVAFLAVFSFFALMPRMGTRRSVSNDEKTVIRMLIERLAVEFGLVQRIQTTGVEKSPPITTDPARLASITINETNHQQFTSTAAHGTDNAGSAGDTKSGCGEDDINTRDGDVNKTGGVIPAHACTICLEEFSIGHSVRVLDCQHTFHTACIDPWLSAISSLCPICKQDARSSEEIAQHNERVAQINRDYESIIADISAAFEGRIDQESTRLLGWVITRPHRVEIIMRWRASGRIVGRFTTSQLIRERQVEREEIGIVEVIEVLLNPPIQTEVETAEQENASATRYPPLAAAQEA